MHFPDDKEGVQRFMMEASILAQLDHPNIIRVFDFGQSDGMMFLVMELIDGDTLKQHVIQHQVLSVQDFILIAKQLAGANSRIPPSKYCPPRHQTIQCSSKDKR